MRKNTEQNMISVELMERVVNVECAESLIGVSVNSTAYIIEPAPDVYDGIYDVTPEAHREVTLNTANTYLKKDVTVRKVPFFETSNRYGDTVYIASEVN